MGPITIVARKENDTMGERRRDAVDMLVGCNIRTLRQDRGMSQTELARKIGVTFQQVQKYENGTNRVGSGRLFKIASILNVPITAFFEGATQVASDNDCSSSPVALLAEPYALRLLQAFCALDNIELRRSITEFAEQIARGNAQRHAGNEDIEPERTALL
jgi:transcriptional regulator with XRE-family HTH domain